MRISRAALAATVLAGATAVGFAVSVGTAAADSDEKLPIKSFGDIAVDSVHKRVFISEPTAGRVISTTYQGHKVAVLAGLAGVSALAVSEDAGELYAVLADGGAIVEISTTTFTESKRYPINGVSKLGDLTAPVNGKLWFSYASGTSGNFGSVDLTTSEVRLHNTIGESANFYDAPVLSVAPGTSGLLAVTGTRSTSGNSAVYDISSGGEQLKLSAASPGEVVNDSGLTADGAHLLHAKWSGVDRFSIAEGSKDAPYSGQQTASVVSVARDGRLAFGTNVSGQKDVSVFRPGATEPEMSFDLSTTYYSEPQLVRRGLIWEPGGPRIFAVVTAGVDQYWLFTLNDPDPVLPDPTTSVPAIRLTGPSQAPPGKPLVITGKVTAVPQLPVGTELTVLRNPGTAVQVRLAPVKTDATGAFTITDTPTFEGRQEYEVRYAGDNWLHQPSSWSHFLQVQRVAPSLSLTRSPAAGVLPYGTTVTLTATLGTTYKNRIVEFWADPAGNDQAPRLIKRAVVYSNGKMLASVTVTRNTVVTVKFTGDAAYLPVSRSVSLWTGVAASTTLTKHYKTAKIGGVSYQYFRKSVAPVVNQTMTAAPNRKVRSVIQIWSGGKWQLWSARDTKLTTAGKASFAFVTGAKAGSMFRVRAEYIIGTSGDSLNTNTQGAWKYFTLTN